MNKKEIKPVGIFIPPGEGEDPSPQDDSSVKTRRRKEKTQKVSFLTSTKKGIIRMTLQLLATVTVASIVGLTAPATGLADTTGEIEMQRMQIEEAYADSDPSFLDKTVGLLKLGGSAISEKVADFRDPEGKLIKIQLENDELRRKIAELHRESSKRRVLEVVNYDQATQCLDVLKTTLNTYKPTLVEQYIQTVEGDK